MFFIESFRKWFQRKSRPIVARTSIRKRKSSTRLRLEALEDRLAPASAIWTDAGGDHLWSNGGNWTGGTGPGGIPGVADVAVFDTTQGGSNDAATIDPGFSTSIQGIEILHYTGTITESADLSLTTATGY